MVKRNRPPEVNVTSARLADGTRRCYFSLRGRKGTRFWTDGVREPTDPAFYEAYSAAIARAAPKADGRLTKAAVDAWLSSAEVKSRADRTQEDYRKWALRFAAEFGDDPIRMFEEPDSRGEVNNWRQQWAHSPKQFDYAGTVATCFLNWAVEYTDLREHHCHKLKKVYEVDRSEIVWTPEDRATFAAVAPEWARRILTVACEAGLRPGDMIRLTRDDIEATPGGRRLKVRTNKRGRRAYIPVTPELERVIDDTPLARSLILVSERGKPLTEHRASEGVRQWRDKAGLSTDLSLADARGTATTRLLIAGLSLNEIASHMGWSLRYAQNVIERYAAVSPGDSDAVLRRLAEATEGAA